MLKHLAALAAVLISAAPVPAAALGFTGQTMNEGPAPGGRCALPSLTFTMGPEVGPVTGTSNLGDFAPWQSHCTVPGPGASFTDGLFDFDFGEGDILSGTYVGTPFPTDSMGLIGFDQLFTIRGGSGRFAGATGSFTGEGTIQIRPGQNALGIANLSGSIETVPEPAALGAARDRRRMAGAPAAVSAARCPMT